MNCRYIISLVRRNLNEKNKLVILKLETENVELKQMINTQVKNNLESTGEKKKRKGNEEILLSSPSFQIIRQSSIEGINSSQESYTQ